MPIDFPTRKLADRATTTPTAPATDDTLQGQTAAGTDRVFLLGNLAGLAPLSIANDQAPYFSGGAWGAYSLTTAGRAIAGAADGAAQRALVGAVGLTGAESIAGAKAFTSDVNITKTDPSLLLNTNNTATTLRIGVNSSTGSIVFVSGGTTYLGINTGTLTALFRSSLSPADNNLYSLGTASLRWTTVFATNGTINTSDARLKTDPRRKRDAEYRAAIEILRLPDVWRWLRRVHGDGECEPEGREARKHFGPTVQAAMAIMQAHGLDPFEYSAFCYDQWDAEPEQWHEWKAEIDPETGEVTREAGRELVQEAREAGDRYSFRITELIWFCASALARQHDELEATVASQAAELASAMDLVQQLMDRVATLEARA